MAGLLWVVLTLLALPAFSQNKKELQKQRDDLNKKIETTKKLINQSESDQKHTLNQIQVIQQQIQFREELLKNIQKDISGIDTEIARKEAAIKGLSEQVQKLKDEYALMIVSAYKNRSAYDQLVFILSAEDFNQAAKRMKMTSHYAEVRAEQMELIKETQAELEAGIKALEADKTEKARLAEEKEVEKQKIADDKSKQQQKLTSLKTEEQKLRDQQKKHESDRKALTAKIEEIIKKEMEKATKPAAGTTTPKSLELAPEAKILNADFEKNKGALPWPVGSGVITTAFGKQPHPVVANTFINNNGVDFTTEKNAQVLAVFSGTVTSVFAIPGAGQNVIVTHGNYKTVYSGLATLNVKMGDKISAKQNIGTVLNDGEQTVLHFELWKVTPEGGVPQNPSLWLKKR
ncbi:MAG: peptidoglycan DD-metalloendopeptidase family protein [Flavobacteriales bacterium]|nr:peptidoglycan DD-metalloendopeptidase family protein [Flavobacteriales bacterium]